MTTVPQMKTVIGLFDTMEEAQYTVQDLVANGFSRDDISLITSDAAGRFTDRGRQVGTEHEAAEGAGAGATGGTVVGGFTGLLVGIGALTLPGIGPIIAAGPILTVIGTTALGAGLGAVAGGIIGALTGLGVPEHDANTYAEGVRRGGTLVIVQTADMMVDRAYTILQDRGAVDMNRRSAQWRQSGWSAFDPNAGPYQP